MKNGSIKQQNKDDNKIEQLEKKIEKPVKKYVGFFRIDEDRQKKFSDDIKERSKPKLDYIVLTICSTIIVALGLITDNAAVVIGGMIIAPLIWPFLALALAIIKGNRRLLKRTILTILKSTLIIFLVSFVIGVFSPYLGESREIIIRTKPTLFELFIALAAGFVGAFAIAHPKLSSALAGVVAAVALVPPLSVMGIMFATGNFVLATGAALLYFTNLIAMTFSSIILFLLVGVKFPRRGSSKSLAMGNVSWFVIFLIIIIIPLTLVMKGILLENQQRGAIRDVIENYTTNTVITDLSVDSNGGLVLINATLRSPNEITSLHVRRLSDILVDELDRQVSLTINVVPTYEASQNVK